MFRTATGQTGRDAYLNELAALANADRELRARAQRLADAMRAELVTAPDVEASIASERFPDATHTVAAMHSAAFIDGGDLRLIDETVALVSQVPSDWRPGTGEPSEHTIEYLRHNARLRGEGNVYRAILDTIES